MSDPTVVEDDESDDAVVAEFPVFLSQDLCTPNDLFLYLLQYPLRPLSRPYEADLGELSSIRIRHRSKQMEMKYKLHTQNEEHYDDTSDYPTKELKLQSKRIQPKTNYAVGVFRNGQLHLTPLAAVCRMRPSLEYIDEKEKADSEASKRTMEEIKAQNEEEMNELSGQNAGEELSSAESGLKAVTMKVKKKETERTQAYKRMSHAHHKAEEEKEEWMEMKYFPHNSMESQSVFEKLVCTNSQIVPFDIPAEYYFHYMHHENTFPASTPAEVTAATSAVSNQPAVSHAPITDYSVPLPTRLFALLKNARILSTSQTVHAFHIRTRESLAEVLQFLDEHALLVHGNWLLRSEYAFSKSNNPEALKAAEAAKKETELRPVTTSFLSSAYRNAQERENPLARIEERLRYCRDYLLCQFAKSPNWTVHRSELAKIFELDFERMTGLFDEFSIKTPDKSTDEYVLKLPRDQTFLNSFAHYAKRHEKLINDLEVTARRILQIKPQTASLPSVAASGTQSNSSAPSDSMRT